MDRSTASAREVIGGSNSIQTGWSLRRDRSDIETSGWPPRIMDECAREIKTYPDQHLIHLKLKVKFREVL
jgi:hypothetical protein